MPAPLREAAGIKGDHAIGFPQLIDHLSDQHRHQRAMSPGRCADELLDDQALDINQSGDLLGILAVQVGQQARQVELHIALSRFGLQAVLIRRSEVAQTVNNGFEHAGKNDAVPQQCLLPLCPRRCHLFASSTGHIDTGC